MKKFTKACLITALILFIAGCIFCGIFGILGGFSWLEDAGGEPVCLGQLGSLVFTTDGYGLEIWNENEWNERGDGMQTNAEYGDEVVQTAYSAADVTDIEIDLNGQNLIIEESGDEYIWIGDSSGRGIISYGMKGSVFMVVGRGNAHRILKNISRASKGGTVYLYLPKEMSLSSIEMDVGAGRLSSAGPLKADEINLELGAGEFDIEEIKAREVVVDIGAGKADIGSVESEVANIEVGAGALEVNGGCIGELVMEVGMGEIIFAGEINGNAYVSCGMGNIAMKLKGEESGYNYNLECAMGNIRIGNNKYTALASERVVDNGSASTFAVECSMGNIDIDFE